MATYTPNLNLIKPEDADFFSKDHQNANMDIIDGLAVLKGTASPTTATVGIVGQFYLNTTNNTLYQCVGVVDTTYMWEPVINEPIGLVKEYAGTDLGSNWLLCNGAKITQATYPELYEKLSAFEIDLRVNTPYAGYAGLDAPLSRMTGSYTGFPAVKCKVNGKLFAVMDKGQASYSYVFCSADEGKTWSATPLATDGNGSYALNGVYFVNGYYMLLLCCYDASSNWYLRAYYSTTGTSGWSYVQLTNGTSSLGDYTPWHVEYKAASNTYYFYYRVSTTVLRVYYTVGLSGIASLDLTTSTSLIKTAETMYSIEASTLYKIQYGVKINIGTTTAQIPNYGHMERGAVIDENGDLYGLVAPLSGTSYLFKVAGITTESGSHTLTFVSWTDFAYLKADMCFVRNRVFVATLSSNLTAPVLNLYEVSSSLSMTLIDSVTLSATMASEHFQVQCDSRSTDLTIVVCLGTNNTGNNTKIYVISCPVALPIYSDSVYHYMKASD